MKTLNMQITLSTYQELSDNGQLNPSFVKDIFEYTDSYFVYGCKEKLPVLSEPTVKYALKVNEYLHSSLKYQALEMGITLSELSGRLFEKYYKEVK